ATAAEVSRVLLAHLCRCTGWQPIVEAALNALSPSPSGPGYAPADAAPGSSGRPRSEVALGTSLDAHSDTAPGTSLRRPRDLQAAARRAALEGGTPQQVGPDIVLGRAGFADDTAPPDALVAVPDGRGGWAVGETLASARAAAAEVPGRRSGGSLVYPVSVPPGDWDLTLQTTWVEPAYLETDASWCRPGEAPVSALANGGAFGGKVSSVAPAAAASLAAQYGRPVRVLLSRPDTVRMGPKRPPIGAGLSSSGHGVVRVACTPGVEQVVASVAPDLRVELVEVVEPPTSLALRGAAWAEAAILLAALAARPAASPSGTSSSATVRSPAGALATARVTVDEAGLPTHVAIRLHAGDPLDEVVLRSYATGAAHMALGWVCSEGISVGADGIPDDLTIRSFGVLRARDTPPIAVSLEGDGEPVEGSGAVFAAIAAACWSAQGLPPRWPTRRGGFS
ncbi:MAG: molybdopterin cofactor-binding domain-containing protein, partial [Acidimicrobiales bacterium]